MNIDTHLTVGLNDVLHLTNMAENNNLDEEEQLARKVEIFMSRVRDFYNTTQQQQCQPCFALHNSTGCLATRRETGRHTTTCWTPSTSP